MPPVSLWLIALLVVVTAAALLAPPVATGWQLEPFSCDLGGSPDWAATILNRRHLISYGILAALAFRVFRNQSIWTPIIFMVAVTGAVEVEQAIFGSGHCRLRDMVPNLAAITIGWLAALLIARLRRNSDRDTARFRHVLTRRARGRSFDDA
ncbi:hypothetical protein [Sphingosinicella terrae]|uniref:hypothetical protein n=1 Tax=Sphingosinicella terrae TaxID=2172047 RepID=UPI000E0D6D59|nr:hypothetical protein [Sphingosinicella terrae]